MNHRWNAIGLALCLLTLANLALEIGNFSAIRGSMGGMWAGYRSSCSVLYRCQTTLARDILGWLAHPSKDAGIGE